MTEELQLAAGSFRWWCAVEAATGAEESPEVSDLPGETETEQLLAAVAVEEVSYRLRRAHDHLDRIDVESLSPEAKQVATLLALRLRLRESETAVVGEIETLIASLDDDQQATRARSRHLLGQALLRENDLGGALAAFVEALEEIGEAPAHNWILDGIVQIYLGLGAWTEGRRTLKEVLERKKARSDALGVVISIGHLANMEISLGHPRVGLTALDEVWESFSAGLSDLSRLRLRAVQLYAALGAHRQGDCSGEELFQRATELDGELERTSDRKHFWSGIAAMTRARVDAIVGDQDAAAANLDIAHSILEGGEMEMLVSYWRARLLSEVTGSEELHALEASLGGLSSATEAGVLSRLLLAEKAAALASGEEAARHLDIAYASALETNRPTLLAQVSREFSKIDPKRHARREIERFSGRPAEELEETSEEEATIIFADLAGFTKRSTELLPAEVMATVRGLFELAVPLLAEHKVRPLQHLGDGLLAACQGPGHQQRGLAFARDLVERSHQATRVRQAIGDPWELELRAGVASGKVVFGLLGSGFKQEYLAIGLTTNLAARLQSRGEPGEVVVTLEAALAAGIGADDEKVIVEEHDLKGITGAVEIARLLC